MTESTELVTIEPKNIPSVFQTGGTDDILAKIEQEAKSFVFDLTTETGRKEIASLAYKIARSKTTLDEMGKNLMADKKAEIDAVNAERKKVRDRLDALKDEVRKPLTDWENAQKEHIAKCNNLIAWFESQAQAAKDNWKNLSVDDLQKSIAAIKLHNTHDWREFSYKAKTAIDESVKTIEEVILQKHKHNAEQAELEQLRKEKEERERKEREEAIAKEAAEKARIAAEEEAKRKAEEYDRQAKALAQEAARKAAEEQARIEAERQKAIAQAEAEKKARLEAEQKAEREKQEAIAREKAAQEKAKADAAAAVEAERQAIKAKADKEAADRAKREANDRHKIKINNQAIAAIIEHVAIDKAYAVDIVSAIANGKIPHIKLEY